jgi:hypothetical protein
VKRFRITDLLVGIILVSSAFTQQSSQQSVSSSSIPSSGSPGLDEYRASRIAIYTDDFGELKRYREADAALGAPKAGEMRVVFLGDSITDYWKLADYFPGKPYAVIEPRHRRAEHAADAGALPPGCD